MEEQEETFKSFRLSAAIRHPDFHFPSRSVHARSEQIPQPTNIPTILKGCFPLHAQPSTAQLQAQPQARRDVPAWAHDQCIPAWSYYADYQKHHHHTQPVMGGDLVKSDDLPITGEAKEQGTQETPATTRESTPVGEPGEETPAGKSEGADADGLAKPLSVVAGERKAFEPTVPASGVPAPSQESTHKPDARGPLPPAGLGPRHHLEAYILRPSTFTFKDSVTWFHEVQHLYLDEGTMKDYLDKQSPSYSILHAVGGLLPDQLRLIQARTRSRGGSIMSIQHGEPTYMPTPMGTFQVKPVIFVITTTAAPEEEGTQDENGPSASAEEAKTSAFDGFNPGRWKPFVPPQPDTTSSFQTNNGVAFGTTDAYKNHLREQGEECFRLEEDPHCPGALTRYMTIPASDRHAQSDHSLEEIRVEDYKDGRTGPMKGNFFWYPWERNRAGSEKPFGGQYDNPRNGFGSSFSAALGRPPFGGQFGSANTGGGLFGNRAAPMGGLFGQQPQPTGGMFGSPNTGGGLIGQPTPSTQQSQPAGGLFGRPSPGGGGLFGGFGTRNNYSNNNNTSASVFGQNTAPNQGLFGTAPPAAPSNSLFGRPSAGSGGVPSGFGTHNNAGSSVFGQNTDPGQALFNTALSTAPNSSLFGQPKNTASPSLFAPPSRSEPAPPAPGFFGTAPTASSSGTGLFGNTSNAPTTKSPGTAAQPAPTHGSFPTGQPRTTLSSYCTGLNTSSQYNNWDNAPPSNNIVEPSSYTTTGALPNPQTSSRLLGASPAAKPPAAVPNTTTPNTTPTTMTSTPAHPLVHRGPTTNTSTSSPIAILAAAAGPPIASWICRFCATRLVYHSRAEQVAGECDACKENKETTCRLCERKIKESAREAGHEGAEEVGRMGVTAGMSALGLGRGGGSSSEMEREKKREDGDGKKEGDNESGEGGIENGKNEDGEGNGEGNTRNEAEMGKWIALREEDDDGDASDRDDVDDRD